MFGNRPLHSIARRRSVRLLGLAHPFIYTVFKYKSTRVGFTLSYAEFTHLLAVTPSLYHRCTRQETSINLLPLLETRGNSSENTPLYSFNLVSRELVVWNDHTCSIGRTPLISIPPGFYRLFQYGRCHHVALRSPSARLCKPHAHHNSPIGTTSCRSL